MRWSFLLCGAVATGLGLCSLAGAQSNEVGLLIGGALTPSQASGSSTIGFDPSLAFSVEYGHRVLKTPVGALLAGVDFAASPLDVITNSGPGTAIDQYAYIFLTPELRYKAPAVAGFTPWVSVGGGYARFREGDLRNGQRNTEPGTNTGAAEVSGGVDLNQAVKLLLPIGFRFEVRDYISGKPQYQVDTGAGTQNNVVISGGLVLHF
jgi:hypothetical protein